MTPALRTLLALSLCDNYNKWIGDLCRPHLGDGIANAEIGCGVGNVLQYLGDTTVGFDPDNRVCMIARGVTGSPRIFNESLEAMHASQDHNQADCLVCVNVLEHIEHDYVALCQMRDLLKPGGKLCLFVPAHPWLYGSVDKAVGHYRRYTRRGVLDKMRLAGFGIVDVRWFNPLGVAGWAVNNLLKQKHPSLLSVMAFDKLVPILRKWQRPPVGLSLFAVGEK